MVTSIAPDLPVTQEALERALASVEGVLAQLGLEARIEVSTYQDHEYVEPPRALIEALVREATIKQIVDLIGKVGRAWHDAGINPDWKFAFDANRE